MFTSSETTGRPTANTLPVRGEYHPDMYSESGTRTVLTRKKANATFLEATSILVTPCDNGADNNLRGSVYQCAG